MSAFNSNNNNNKAKTPKKFTEEQMNKVISVSSEEIYFIDRDIKKAENNYEDTKTLELQKGITVFTTITNTIEKFGQEKFAFKILSGSISSFVNNKNRAKAKENLLNHFKSNTYKNINLTIGNEKKKLWEFVDENFDSMCYFFENTYDKNIPNADSLKKLGEFRTATSYLTNGLAEDTLNALSKATSEEDFYKKAKEEHGKIKKEMEENKKLTQDNNKTMVKCALGFGAAGLAIAFPPLIFISAFLLIFDNAKDRSGNRTLPFGDIVGAAINTTKKVLGEIDQTITNQVNKLKSEKENEEDEKFNKTVDELKKHSEEIRKFAGELDKGKAIEILGDMNITKENFKTINAILGIERYAKHQLLSKTMNSEKSLENGKRVIENESKIKNYNFL